MPNIGLKAFPPLSGLLRILVSEVRYSIRRPFVLLPYKTPECYLAFHRVKKKKVTSVGHSQKFAFP